MGLGLGAQLLPCSDQWSGLAHFYLSLTALEAPGEAELIKPVGKALCGSMLTNSGSLELARVGKPILEAA